MYMYGDGRDAVSFWLSLDWWWKGLAGGRLGLKEGKRVGVWEPAEREQGGKE